MPPCEVLSSTHLNVSFQRGVVGENLIAWYELVSKIVTIRFSKIKDVSIGTCSRVVLSQ